MFTPNFSSRRRFFTSAIAGFTALAAFAATSCAAPRRPIPGGMPLRSNVGGYELQVLVDGSLARSYAYGGETHVLGALGARYTLRVVNHTGRRIEAVVSVDGRDAIDGKTADVRSKRGYLVPAWGAVDIDGWRLSRAEVAAFRFSSVADSYAARTGSAREVGVIGVAVFPERVTPPRPVYAPPRVPYDPAPWGYDGSGAGREQRNRSDGDFQPERHASKQKAGRAAAAEAPAAAAPRASSGNLADGVGEAESSRGPAPSRRPGLGTEFGEAVTSPVRDVAFVRANHNNPAVILGARYNDREGLIALGIDVDGWNNGDDDLAWRQSATPFPASTRRYATPPAGWHQGCCVGY